jgi:hypothetical protein
MKAQGSGAIELAAEETRFNKEVVDWRLMGQLSRNLKESISFGERWDCRRI